jgi:Family of unknown function (DUF6611)
MEAKPPGLGLLRRCWLRLLDGEHPWGSFDVWHDRFGVTRYCLVVFPPGITESERRRVRLARGWPLWGALTWVLCEIGLNQLTGPGSALAVSTAATVGLGLAAMAAAGEPRIRVRAMAATVMAGHHDPVSKAVRDSLEKLASSLFEADERLSLGVISRTEHEAIWWRVYDQMESRHSATPGMHGSESGA